jgi:hypothetical protein
MVGVEPLIFNNRQAVSVNLFPVESREAAVKALHSLI